MNRWVWTAAAATGWVGLTTTQADTPLPTAGEVITLRTAGQPERKVQVLKAERAADGTVLTDVKDMASGLVYTLTDARGTARPPEAAARPAVVPPAPPPTGRPVGSPVPALTHWDTGKPPTPLFGASAKPVAPATPKQPTVLGPAAKPREIDPLLAAAAARRTDPVMPAKTPTLLGKLFGTDKPAVPAPRVGGSPAVAATFGPPAGLKADGNVIRPSAFSAPPIQPQPQAGTTTPVATLPKPTPAAAPTRVMLVPDATNPVLATDPPRVSAVVPAPTPAVPAVLAAPTPVVAAPAAEPMLTIAPPVLTAAPPMLPSPTEPTLTAPPVVAQPVLAEPPAVAPPPTPVAEAPAAPVQTPTLQPAAPVTVAAPPAPARVSLEEMKPAPQLVPLPPLDAAVPAAPPKPAPNAFEPVPVMLPSAHEPAPAAPGPVVVAPTLAPAAPVVTPTTPTTAPAAPMVIPAEPPVAPAAPAVTAAPTAAVVPASHPDERMRAELSGTVQALRSGTRPRQRLEAASALANGPYSNRIEVQAVILEAARSDPSPVIRGHCIRLLTQLGVTDPSYQDDLLKWANDPEPAVSRAAGDALQKLAGK